jgi:hypothetical protein
MKRRHHPEVFPWAVKRRLTTANTFRFIALATDSGIDNWTIPIWARPAHVQGISG